MNYATMTTDALRAYVVRQVRLVYKGSVPEALAAAQAFADIGLSNDIHVGKKDLNEREALEWYAGQLISIVDEPSWYCVNSWINCCEKFTGVDHLKESADFLKEGGE